MDYAEKKSDDSVAKHDDEDGYKDNVAASRLKTNEKRNDKVPFAIKGA